MIIYIIEHWEIVNMCDTHLIYYDVYKTREKAMEENTCAVESEGELYRVINQNGAGKLLVVVEL